MTPLFPRTDQLSPPLSAVLISHRHYDHLSPESIEEIQDRIAKQRVLEARAEGEGQAVFPLADGDANRHPE